ncbi:Uncharacterised protein [Salmonella enterica subsp. enterica serovar Bovismorbificans]|nr:Uncharacterised protein [Salmonella enterica subsp. enterica serovar Bovismorbificans]CPR53251.1 Uncharacterised protein [Salmonella enterica subsp. enterica serovar Bovismorbificans]
MQATLPVSLRHHHIFTLITNFTQRVFAGVIHGGRIRQRRRVEVLHLIQTEAVALEPQRQIHHILVPRARMRGDKIRDQILLFSGLFRVKVK